MSLARRKSVRVAGGVLLALLLAVVAVKVFLPAEKIRDLALAQAEARLGREVSVGEVAVSLRGGLGVRLADFIVHNPAGFDGEPLMATKALDLKLELGPLIKGEIRVNRLVVDRPVVNLVRLADGSDNFTFAPAVAAAEQPSPNSGGTAAAAPPPLSVASLSLQDGQLSFSDATVAAGGVQQIQMDDLDLVLSLVDPAPGRFQSAGKISIAKVEVTGPEGLSDLHMAAEFDVTWDAVASQLDIARLAMDVNGIALAGSGRLVTAGTTPVGELKIELAETPLANLVAMMPPESAAKIRTSQGGDGSLTAMIDLSLAADESAHATGNLAVSNLVVAEAELPALNTTLDFDVTWHTPASKLVITRAEAKVNGLPLSASGQLVTADGAATGQVQIQARNLALDDLIVFVPPEFAAKMQGHKNSGRVSATVDLKLTGDQAVPVHSSGKVVVENIDLAVAQSFLPPEQKGTVAGHGDLELSFVDKTGDPAQMTYAGTFTARGVSFTESGLVDELENLDAKLTFTQDKFTVERCQAKFASGSFALTGSLSDPFPYFLPPEMQVDAKMKTPHLSFDLRSPHLDVDRLLPAASPTDPGADQNGTPAAPRKTTVPEGMEFPGLSCAGTFSADSLIYMQVPLTHVTGKVKLRDRLFSVYDVKGAVYHGQVDGQVDVDLNDLNEPVYSGKYQARNIEVDNFVTRFAGMAGVVFGGCNLSGGFAARGLDPEAIRNSLTLDADAGIKKGKVVTTGNVYSALNSLAGRTGQTLNQEQILRDLATHISVENGRVGVSALTTRLGQFGDVTVDGYYSFNGDLDYRGKILLTKAQTDQLFNGNSMLRELAKLLGSQRPDRLELPLSVGGTQTKPTMKLDLGVVTDDLQKRAVKEQGRKLEDEAKNKLGDLLKKWK